MILPVRCWTCAKVLNGWNTYLSLIAKDFTEKEALDSMGYTRFCCRRMILSHVDLMDQRNQFKTADSFPEADKLEQKESQ